ncbi:MAG: hypothetical protein WD271_08120 [Acidimicrobiia bacterium]
MGGRESLGDRRRVETVICWALTVGVVFQVAQRFAKTGYDLSEYGRSLWYVTYRFGFVRRGLAGEMLRIALGHTPSLGAVDFVQNVVAGVMLGAAIALVVLLCRQRTVIAYAAAALLVVAPFGLDTVGGQRRPDLFGYFLLAMLGIWAATRRVNAIVLGLVGGVLLGVSTLFSEASPLIIGPWLLLVVVASARARARSRSEPWCAMVLCTLPSVLALGLLAATGRGSSQTVASLEGAAPPEIQAHGSVFPYLNDTFRSSFERVVHGPGNPPLSILVGTVFAVLLLFCAGNCFSYARAVWTWILPTRFLRVAWASGTLAAAIVLFALGFDWLRWISSIGFAALLAGGAIVLLDGRVLDGGRSARAPDREIWHRSVPSEVSVSIPGLLTLAVATYLLVLAPLPNFIKNVGDTAQTLLSVPR